MFSITHFQFLFLLHRVYRFDMNSTAIDKIKHRGNNSDGRREIIQCIFYSAPLSCLIYIHSANYTNIRNTVTMVSSGVFFQSILPYPIRIPTILFIFVYNLVGALPFLLLLSLYLTTFDMAATVYIRIKLEWDYVHRTVTLSMPL